MTYDGSMDRHDSRMPVCAFLLAEVRLVPGVLNMQLDWLLHYAASNAGSEGLIEEPAKKTENLEYGIWLTVMSWLSSKDMFQCTRSCSTFHKLVAPSGPAFEFWKQHCSAGPVGIHTMDVVWLHAVASSSVIASYMERAKHVKIAGELRFQAAQELKAFATAFDYTVTLFPYARYFAPTGAALPGACSLVPGQKSPFAAQWRFDSPEVASFCEAYFPRAFFGALYSKPVKFRWAVGPGRTVDIYVYLLLCMTNDGRFMLAWESSVSGVLVQDLDYVELLVLGVAMDASDGATMPVAILPYSGLGAKGSSSYPAVYETVCCQFRTDDYIFHVIRSGGPLTCIVNLILKCAGEQQTITCESGKSAASCQACVSRSCV